MEVLKQFIIEKHVYDRIIKMRDDDIDIPWNSYDEFYEWNIACLNAAPADDVAWLTGLCKRMADSKIQLMDEEYCIGMTAYAFYFNHDETIMIVNLR